MQVYDQSNKSDVLKEQTVMESEIIPPSNCIDFSMGIKNQINIVKRVQDIVLNTRLEALGDAQSLECKQCNAHLAKCGKHRSVFHDVFTDHEVTFQRYKCRKCSYETPATVRSFLGTIQSGELQKIQAELGATHPYREAENLLFLFSGCHRNVNNHDRIKHVTESTGNALEKITEEEKEVLVAEESSELIINVDSGHIKTTEEGIRSMEAMTAVIYDPKASKGNSKNTRHYLNSKNCAASIKDDNQEQMISSSIVAALKQGLGKNTHVTALCDGAQNCWNVIKALEPLCHSVTKILDWFHLSMKIENISLTQELQDKLLKVKWHLWRGNIDKAVSKLEILTEESKEEKHINRLSKLQKYILNNRTKIVNYEERQNKGLVFTSNLAESTVESLINRRCKGHQHMRWSRKGLNPILQIRSALNSKNEWAQKWKTAVLNAA